jgi:uncharacterized membrane protein
MEQIVDMAKFIGRFHPAIIHLPIGFLTLAILLQVCSNHPAYAKVKPALPFIWFAGFISSFLSVALGLLLSSDGDYDKNIIAWHKWSGIGLTLTVLVYYFISATKWERVKTISPAFMPPFLLTIIGALLLLTGHNGGTLTHGKGYLSEYAPKFIQNITHGPVIKSELKRFESIDSADIFSDAVLPILRSKCVSCHNQNKRKGQLILASYADIMKGGKQGSEITPGSSTSSELYRRITLPHDHKESMPGDGKKPLSDDQIAILEWWIDQQALQKGLIADLHPDVEMIKLFERFFGVHDDNQSMPYVVPPDKSAIDHLIGQGYTIRNITSGNNLLDIKSGNSLFKSEDLKYLKRLADQMMWLNLSNSNLSDQDAAILGSLTNLRKLDLSKNPVTDLGANHLTNLSQLEYLNLYGTNVSDSSVTLLAEMPHLRELYLWQTKVSDTTMESLKSKKKAQLKIIYKIP